MVDLNKNKLMIALDKLSAKEEGRHKIKGGELLYCYRNKIRKVCNEEEILNFRLHDEGLGLDVLVKKDGYLFIFNLIKDCVDTEDVRRV